MFKLNLLAEEKETKTKKHKKLSITFEKQSSKLFTYIIKCFSTSPKIINDERTAFSANGVKTGFPDTKEWNWTLSLCHIQN